jgi:hypothetical protein
MYIFLSLLFGLVAIQVAKLRDEAVELRESMHFQHREVWRTDRETLPHDWTAHGTLEPT